MNVGLPGKKVGRGWDGGCVFYWACPGGHQGFLEKRPWCPVLLVNEDKVPGETSEPSSTNLPGGCGRSVGMRWLFSLSLLGALLLIGIPWRSQALNNVFCKTPRNSVMIRSKMDGVAWMHWTLFGRNKWVRVVIMLNTKAIVIDHFIGAGSF